METRRLCTSKFHQGPRWTLAINFHVKKWGDEEKTWVAGLQSECRACQNMRARRDKAVREGRDPNLTKPRGKISKAEKAKRKKALYDKNMKNKKFREHRRQQMREASTARRRSLGVAPRGSGGWKKHKKKLQNHRVYVDATPLLDHLEPWIERDQSAINKSKEQEVGIGGWETERVFTTDEWKSVLRMQETKIATTKSIDQLLTRIGRPDLFVILYPEDREETAA